MKTLTDDQAATLLAFLDGFDDRSQGWWPEVAEFMGEEAGIEDAEEALQAARQALL
jgi:hypothetical protein